MGPTIEITRAYAGMVEKGRDSDRERDQGQPEARALPEKVEKDVKKARGVSHRRSLRQAPRMDTTETVSFCCLLG